MKISTLTLISIITGCLFTCISSCDIVNPSEGVPAYLQVDTFTFSVLPGQGSASAKITDVWVYDQQSIVGAYEIPETFPILDSGSTQVVLTPGIWDNGIAETRVPYPFYLPDTLTLNLHSGIVSPIIPHFTYRSSAKFYFIEDFEAGNLFDKLDGDTNMIRTTNATEIFEGGGAGAIYLDADHTFYEGITSASYNLPKNEPVYLEINYKCDQAFQVGIFATQDGLNVFNYKWTINPKDFWNKIYLNMGSDVTSLQADTYQILIRAVYDSSNTDSHIYFDNIKLVSY